jgi:hypothetical protein
MQRRVPALLSCLMVKFPRNIPRSMGYGEGSVNGGGEWEGVPPGLAGGRTVVEAREARPAQTLGYVVGGGSSRFHHPRVSTHCRSMQRRVPALRVKREQLERVYLKNGSRQGRIWP